MWEKKKTNWSRISAAWHSRGRADWVCLIAGSDVWCRQIWTLASGSATSLQCHSYSCYSPIQFYSVNKYGSGSIKLSQRDCILVYVIKLAKAILSTLAQGRNNRKHHKSAKLSWNQMAMVVNVLVVFAVFVVDFLVFAGFVLLCLHCCCLHCWLRCRCRQGSLEFNFNLTNSLLFLCR